MEIRERSNFTKTLARIRIPRQTANHLTERITGDYYHASSQFLSQNCKILKDLKESVPEIRGES
jgi:hypothetical protein